MTTRKIKVCTFIYVGFYFLFLIEKIFDLCRNIHQMILLQSKYSILFYILFFIHECINITIPVIILMVLSKIIKYYNDKNKSLPQNATKQSGLLSSSKIIRIIAFICAIIEILCLVIKQYLYSNNFSFTNILNTIPDLLFFEMPLLISFTLVLLSLSYLLRYFEDKVYNRKRLVKLKIIAIIYAISIFVSVFILDSVLITPFTICQLLFRVYAFIMSFILIHIIQKIVDTDIQNNTNKNSDARLHSGLIDKKALITIGIINIVLVFAFSIYISYFAIAKTFNNFLLSLIYTSSIYMFFSFFYLIMLLALSSLFNQINKKEEIQNNAVNFESD